MEIKEITQNKKAYLSLLLLADEQESMIDKYLTKGQMYVLFEKDIPVAECVVLAHDNELEIMNLATDPHFQKQGYAKKLVSFIEDKYRATYSTLIGGTGESPLTLPFYQKPGFEIFDRKKDFFTNNYDHPIFEDGHQLVDMIMLKKSLSN